MNHSTVFAIKFLKQVTGPGKIIVAYQFKKHALGASLGAGAAAGSAWELGRWCCCRLPLLRALALVPRLCALGSLGAGAGAGFHCCVRLGCVACRGAFGS